MGYGPWGHKELDMTEGTWHACTQAPGVYAFQDEAGGPLGCAPSWGRGGRDWHPAGRRATPTPQEWTQGSGALVGGGSAC